MCLNTLIVYIFMKRKQHYLLQMKSLVVASEQSAIKITNNYKVPNENEIIKFTLDNNNRIITDENINKLDDNTIELIKFNTIGDYKHGLLKR